MPSRLDTPAIHVPAGLSRKGQEAIQERVSVTTTEFITGGAYGGVSFGGINSYEISQDPIHERELWSIGAVLKVVTVVANAMSNLPVRVKPREDPDGKPMPIDERLQEAMLQIIDAPNERLTWSDIIAVATKDRLVYGNSYFEIERRGDGSPVGLWYLPAKSTYRVVLPSIDVYQTFVPATGQAFRLPPKEVVHWMSPIRDGYHGLNMLQVALEPLRGMKNVDRFAARLFTSGIPLATINPAEDGRNLSEEDVKEMGQAFVQAQRDGSGIAIMGNGTRIERLALSPNEAQFIETRMQNVTEVARLFGVPPQYAGDYATSTQNATLSTITRQFAEDTIAPLTTQLENALNAKLLPRESGLRFVFDYSSLVRGTAQERAALYKTALAGAPYLTVNEVREMEGLAPIEGGDVLPNKPDPAAEFINKGVSDAGNETNA